VLRPWPALLLSLLACGSNQVSTPTDAPEPLVDAAVCGNRLVEGDEQCDDGDTDDTDGCVACRFATCGDGFVRRGVEDCDETDRHLRPLHHPVRRRRRRSRHRPLLLDRRRDRHRSGQRRDHLRRRRGHLAALDAAGEWAVVAPLWTSPFDGAWLG
jgi:cysteine-rich repeat protein